LSVLNDLKKEIETIEDAKELPDNARIVIEIAKKVDRLQLTISRELVFRAIVQACFGKPEL
jgi:hypothetical protein